MRTCFYTTAVLILFFQFFSTDSSAQNLPHFIENISTEKGLSTNNIYDIVQDDNGFLWIATPDGLNRYDGTEVVQYFHHANANSLPHNYVTCLKKLTGNYIAIGTQGGLAFFNTATGMFKNFYYKQNPALDAHNNFFKRLETDAEGNLWAISGNCIFIFDNTRKLKKVIISSFKPADITSQRIEFAEKVLPLSNGNSLLNLYNRWIIYSLKTNSLTPVNNSVSARQLSFLNNISPPYLNKYFSAGHLYKIFNKYFLCIPSAEDSLFLFNENGNKLSSCYFPYNQYPHVWWEQRISEIDSSKILFLFNDGGFSILPVNWQNNKPELQQLSPPLFTEQHFNTAICDRQKNWWLATNEGGLQKISPFKQGFMGDTLFTKTGIPIKSEIVSVNKSNNKLWVATYGNGFFEIDAATHKQQQHLFSKTNNDMWANYVWNVRPVSNDTLWVGTQAGMFWYNIASEKFGRLPAYKGKPVVIDSVPITTQFTDSHNLVWIGLGTGQGVCCYHIKNKIFTHYRGSSAEGYPLRYPTNIAEDANGNLWFANDGSPVLIRWKRNANVFEKITLPFATQKQIGDLSCIMCEGDSVLWLGSVTCGLIKFNWVENTTNVYSHENGLRNNDFSGIFQDGEKRLWLLTKDGLSCFNRHRKNFVNYTSKDGLPMDYLTNYFFYDTASNLLYGGGNGKIFYFNPDVITFSKPPTKTIITALYVNGKSYMLNGNATAKFKYNQNDISIQYTSVDLVNGAQTKYAYKLIGEDTGWINLGTSGKLILVI